MTQTADTATNVAPTNVPFNLIIATSAEQVRKIAKHYDLSDVRNVDDLDLPSGGAKRGDALNQLLGSVENTITLAVVTDDAWINALLKNMPAMSASVWRSIESKLVGHRTGSQRNLIVLGNSFTSGVRDAENAGNLQVIVAGQNLPSNWKPPIAKPEAKKPEAKKLTFKNPPAPKHPSKIAREETNVKRVEANVKFGKKGDKPQIDRSKKSKGPKPAGSNNGLHDDLYLLAKGHYGSTERNEFLNKAAQIIAYHTGAAMTAGTHREKIVTSLFNTLIAKSNRGYWGGFNLLKEVVTAGGESALELIQTLSGWIGNIPATDAKGEAIPQPQRNHALVKALKWDKPQETLAAPVVDASNDGTSAAASAA